MSREPIAALAVPLQNRKSLYPHPFSQQVAGRARHRIGDHFGLTNFGVNLTELAPGSVSALVHRKRLANSPSGAS
jgi:uncharacterized cupin superfamily protein